LLIPDQDEIQGQTESDGCFPLPGLQSGMVVELKILDTLIKLVRRDFNEDEQLDR